MRLVVAGLAIAVGIASPVLLPSRVAAQVVVDERTGMLKKAPLKAPATQAPTPPAPKQAALNLEEKSYALGSPNDCAGLERALNLPGGNTDINFKLKAASVSCRAKRTQEAQKTRSPEAPVGAKRTSPNDAAQLNEDSIFDLPKTSGAKVTSEDDLFALTPPPSAQKAKSSKKSEDPFALTSNDSSKSYWNGGPSQRAPVTVWRDGKPAGGKSVEDWKVESGEVPVGVTRLGDPFALTNDSARLKDASRQLEAQQRDREQREWEAAERARLAEIQRQQQMAALQRQQEADAQYYANLNRYYQELEAQRQEQRARERDRGSKLDRLLGFELKVPKGYSPPPVYVPPRPVQIPRGGSQQGYSGSAGYNGSGSSPSATMPATGGSSCVHGPHTQC